MRSLARRHANLTTEIADLDRLIEPLVAAINPALTAAYGVGADCAGQLLVTAGQNPERLRSEAAFAMLCGVAPLPASSGKTTRHRLNRGGDQQANAAIYRIALVRMRWTRAPTHATPQPRPLQTRDHPLPQAPHARELYYRQPGCIIGHPDRRGSWLSWWGPGSRSTVSQDAKRSADLIITARTALR